jgi:NAD(P)-dependent dehydrogenase (short-subunit alcohol dehydrogenase family)
MELRDRIAIVTGGASGIGEAVAERFHAEGARHVVVVDLDGDGARAVAERVGGSGFGVDVTDEAAVGELVAKTERDQGPIDVFFSNAGYVTIGGLEAPIADLERMFAVHVSSHAIAARTVLPGMIERGEGYLLSTASAAGLLSQFGSLHYAVTKRAAIALAEWIAITHGHQGIRVSVLCPQAVQTNIDRNSPDRDRLAEGDDVFNVASADGILQPADVADVVVEAMRAERFHVLPHPEVGEYVKRKAEDVDRWIGGMQRWQGQLFPGDAHPANRLRRG